MTARFSHIALVLTAFAAGIAIFLGVFFYATGQLGGGAPAPSAVGGPFRLVDQDGKTVTDKDMLGKPSLVFFGFTHCPDICPTTLFEVSEVLNALGDDAKRVQALFITVDPERDTSAVLKDYLSSFNPQLRGATGDEKAIEQVEKSYRVYAKKVPTKDGDYTMDHTALVYLMDKQGRFVAPFKLKRPPQESAEALRKYL
jgi:protein SCO1/2